MIICKVIISLVFHASATYPHGVHCCNDLLRRSHIAEARSRGNVIQEAAWKRLIKLVRERERSIRAEYRGIAATACMMPRMLFDRVLRIRVNTGTHGDNKNSAFFIVSWGQAGGISVSF